MVDSSGVACGHAGHAEHLTKHFPKNEKKFSLKFIFKPFGFPKPYTTILGKTLQNFR